VIVAGPGNKAVNTSFIWNFEKLEVKITKARSDAAD
jgi:hypothetical protein